MCGQPDIPEAPPVPPSPPSSPLSITPETVTPAPEVAKTGQVKTIKRRRSKRAVQQQQSLGPAMLRIPLNVGVNQGGKKQSLNIPA